MKRILEKSSDHIVHGLWCKEERKVDVAVQCICIMDEVQSKRNITPSSGSTSMAMSLIPINEDMKLGAIDQLNTLVNASSSHVSGTSS